MMIKFQMFFISLLLLGSGSLWGGEDFPETAELSGSAERWYRVELLIYKQKPVPGTVEEVWPHEISLSYPANWVKLKSQEEYIANPHPHPVLAFWLSRIKTSPYTPFVLQGESTKSFSKISKQIERFEAGVLFHGVWWQPFIQNDTRDPLAILIKAGKQYGDHAELEGSVSIKLSRYLHLSTNLWLSEFASPVPDSASSTTPLTNPWPSLPLPPDQLLPLVPDATLPTDAAIHLETVIPESYQPSQVILINQSRRMRSEETHYIDHPKLGIVVRITPQAEKR